MLGIGGWLKGGAVGLGLGFIAGWTVHNWKTTAGEVKGYEAAYASLVTRTANRARLAEANNQANADAHTRLTTEIERLRRANRAPLPVTFRAPEIHEGVARCPDPRGTEWLRRYNEAATLGPVPADSGGVPTDPP